MGEFLLELLFELLLETIAEFSLSVGIDAASRSVKVAREANPIGIAIGLCLLGAMMSVLFTLVFPSRIFPPTKVHGLSLWLSPLLSGGALHLYGLWRQSKGHKPTPLASFWGGFAFALSLSLPRYFLVQQ